jgi:hypothetical protein
MIENSRNWSGYWIALPRRHMKILLLGFVFAAMLLPQQAPPVTGPLTNQRVIELVHAGITGDELRRVIATAPSVSFDLSPAGNQAMISAGVTEDTIKAMAAREKGTVFSPAVGASTASIGANPAQPTPLTDVYQGRGMWDVGLEGTAIIPHSSPSYTVGEVSSETGYFVTRGSLISADVIASFSRGTDDIFLTGNYRYFFGKPTSKILPYLGGGAGGNILHVSGEGTVGNFLAQGGGGVRVFLAPHVAIDIGYTLDYVHVSGLGFKDSSYSEVTVAFAHVFGRGR